MTLISLAKIKFFTLWILHLFIISIITTKISGLSNIFLISQYNSPKPELYGHYIDGCIDTTSSSSEEHTQFITAVNSFHLALTYTREISDTSLAFQEIKISVEGNSLFIDVYYKPTDSHHYSLYSSSHSSHDRNSLPF